MMANDDPPLTERKFSGKILTGFRTGQASAKPGFSRHEAIHSDFWAKLRNDIVEKNAFHTTK